MFLNGEFSAYELRAQENLKESINEFLDDDRLIDQMVGILKEAFVQAYTYHADRADQIKRAHSMIFKEEEI